MRIDHIFHNLNSFGGAEEHITSLAELQMAQGDEVSVCLIQAVTAENQYARRLRTACVPICQWPLWLSRLSGDWDTREAIMRRAIAWLAPLVGVAAFLLKRMSTRPRLNARESVEGRLRMLLGRFFDLRRERQLFLLMLTWRYIWHRPDVMHLHSYGAGLEFVLKWASEHKLATVYQEHSTPDLTKRRTYKPPIGLNLASLVIAVSDTSAQALRQLCEVTRPIYIIPPILSVNGLETRNHKSRQVKPGIVTILTIARLSEEKGLAYLIKCAERVAVGRPGVRFVIYGEGYLQKGLEAQIAAAQLRDQVRLAGSFTRAELPAIMSAADIFVLPSLTEGFPLSIIEAMAWGLPIIATTVGGIPELIQDGVTGLLCPPRDEAALAQAILSLLDDPVRSRQLAAAAKSFHDSRFKPEHLVARFCEVYRQATQA